MFLQFLFIIILVFRSLECSKHFILEPIIVLLIIVNLMIRVFQFVSAQCLDVVIWLAGRVSRWVSSL